MRINCIKTDSCLSNVKHKSLQKEIPNRLRYSHSRENVVNHLVTGFCQEALRNKEMYGAYESITKQLGKRLEERRDYENLKFFDQLERIPYWWISLFRSDPFSTVSVTNPSSNRY